MPGGPTTRKGQRTPSPSQDLAKRVLASVGGARLATNFVDDYAQQFHRPEASAHPARRKELETILGREILLAMAARVASLAQENASRRRAPARGKRIASLDPSAFLRDFVAALSRESGWTAGDAMEFRGDLEIYRRLGAANTLRAISGRARSATGGPFVDRCAILLDPSMIENATRAAGKLLPQIEALAENLFNEVLNRGQ